MKHATPETVISLNHQDKLSGILAKLSQTPRPTLVDLSALKEFTLEDFKALQNWPRKEQLVLRCTNSGIRSMLCRLRLHKLYQVVGAAA